MVKDFNKAGQEIGAKVRHGLAVALVVATVCAVLLLAIVVVMAAVLSAPEVGLAELVATLTAVLAQLGQQGGQVLEALRRLVERLGPVVQRFGLTMTPVRSPADGSLHLVFASDDRDGQLPVAGATVGSLRLDNCRVLLIAMLDDVLAVAGPMAAATVLRAVRPPGGTASV